MAPIGMGRRCYAVFFVGLRKQGCKFDPHRPYQLSDFSRRKKVATNIARSAIAPDERVLIAGELRSDRYNRECAVFLLSGTNSYLNVLM